MNEAYLLTGGNIDDSINYLKKAREAIEINCGVITSQSSVYETEAWGMQDQQSFFNQALKIETELTAEKLMTAILQAEENIGRKREIKYGPRIIDIDILFFNDEVIDLDKLKIPHPQMQHRRFVLQPLNEIASGKIHPVLHKTVHQLFKECNDPLAVNKI